MPFKGDMRLGGRHSNVATLNGTASDFAGVPAYGTFLHGPDDTSRNENDFVGVAFYMPYETNWYADGLGGEYSTETWGLQYLPAGWRTNRVDIVNATFWVDGLGANATWQTSGTDSIEDGTGINYEEGVVYYQAAYGDDIGTSSYYVTYEVADEEKVEVYGVLYSPLRTKEAYYHDGNGGYYSEAIASLLEYQPSGTLITSQIQVNTSMPPDRELGDDEDPHWANYWNGKYLSAYWNGSGGYTVSAPTGNFFPNGTTYYTKYEQDMTQVPELELLGDVGDYFYNGRQTENYFKWNGSGGSGTTTGIVTQPYTPYGTLIGTSGNWNYFWDGLGGYYVEEQTEEE